MSEIPAAPDCSHDLSPLAAIMATLRGSDGCPWDQQQTPESLKGYVLEETYELLEAIDSGNPNEICDELGDLLLQVVFLAQIYSEQQEFDLTSVIEGICAKMIRRHPHVFADADNRDHALRWEQIKQKELQTSGHPQQLSQRLPATLPALKRTQKLLKKTTNSSPADKLQHVFNGYQQLNKGMVDGTCSRQQTRDIVGQLLYDLTGLAVALGMDAEDLLRKKTTSSIAEIDNKNFTSGAPELTNS